MKSAYAHRTVVILLFWMFIIQSKYSCAQSNMQAIQFIPKEFSDVEAMFDTNAEHSLTPFSQWMFFGFDPKYLN